MKSNRILFEAIVSNPDDAVAAEGGGADRFEVCSALALGGLTPSIGTLRTIKEKTDTPAMCMVRPREGGMHYSDGEFESMLSDVKALIEAGADGLVFGFLKPNGDLDLERCRHFLDTVREVSGSRSLETVFHRAFDVISEPEFALEKLIELGVTRILTSGRKAEAEDGIPEIKRMHQQANGRIQILPGGGIHPGNVRKIVAETGVDQVHLYLAAPKKDLSTTGNPQIYFGAFVPSSEVETRAVDESAVREVRALLDAI